MTGEGSLFDVPPAAIGRFRVLHQVGAGASGPVFRAVHPDTAAALAIKLFTLETAGERVSEIIADLEALVADFPQTDGVCEPIDAGVHAGEREERARRALERVGLGDRADHRPGELSGGQQQRVAVARALVTEPSLILADEPTGNLDSSSSADVLGLFRELYESGRTIVLITHDPEVAEAADRVITIRDGLVTTPIGARR